MIFDIAKTTIDTKLSKKTTQKCKFQNGKFSLIKKSGNLDQGLNNLVDLIIYWYKPQPAIDPDSGERQFIHKFQGNVWQTSYAYLTKKLGANKSTIRRRIIKLEELGYVKREFKDISVDGQEYNNRLFLHLSNDFFKKVTGFNKASYNGEDKMFIDSKVFAALPEEYTRERMNEKMTIGNDQIPYGQKKVILNIDIYNTIFKNRSSKSSLKKNKIKAKSITTKTQQKTKQPNREENKIKQGYCEDKGHDQDDDTPNDGLRSDNSNKSEQPKPKNLASKAALVYKFAKETATKVVTKIRGNKRKALSEFYPLSEEDAEALRENSGREFNVNFMNQLLLKLAKNKPDHGFFTKDLFMKYMTKVLTNELRQTVNTNNEGYKLREEATKEMKEIKNQEQYLEEVEYSTDTSCCGQLRRKIAAVFEAEVAYKILSGYRLDNSYDSARNDSNRCNVESNSKEAKVGNSSFEYELVAISQQSKELSVGEQLRLLKQVKAVYGDSIEKLRFKVADRAKNKLAEAVFDSVKADMAGVGPVVVLGDPSSIWHKISSALLKQYGEAVHTSWFSKLEAEEDRTNKKLKLKAPTNFISSWIDEKYGYLISSLLREHQYSYEIC